MAINGWRPKKRKWNWRRFLTLEERQTIARADKAKTAWKKLNHDRAAIINRAIQRAKYRALSPEKPNE